MFWGFAVCPAPPHPLGQLARFKGPLHFVFSLKVAERILYLSSIGFCIGAAWVLVTRVPRGMWLLLFLVLPAYSGRTLIRNEDFSSDLALWGSLARDFPNNVMGHASYAEELVKLGDFDGALAQLAEADARMREWRPGYYLFAQGATLVRMS